MTPGIMAPAITVPARQPASPCGEAGQADQPARGGGACTRTDDRHCIVGTLETSKSMAEPCDAASHATVLRVTFVRLAHALDCLAPDYLASECLGRAGARRSVPVYTPAMSDSSLSQPFAPIPDSPERAMPADGRQSPRALAIRRGVGRFFVQAGAVCLYEAGLANGRRADIMALTADGSITIIEVKSSPADLRADSKWPDYLDYCDRFLFATAPDVPQALFPAGEGLMVADGYGAHVVREPKLLKLHAARRKALTLRLARLAIGRLHHLDDPQAHLPET